MTEPLSLTMGQQFEIERFNRAIDGTSDPNSLRAISKQLLQAWQTQKAATQWVMRQQLGAPPSVALAASASGREPNRPAGSANHSPNPRNHNTPDIL